MLVHAYNQEFAWWKQEVCEFMIPFSNTGIEAILSYMRLIQKETMMGRKQKSMGATKVYIFL